MYDKSLYAHYNVISENTLTLYHITRLVINVTSIRKRKPHITIQNNLFILVHKWRDHFNVKM